MIIKPFIVNASGEWPLRLTDSITTGQKLRILVIPEEGEPNLDTIKEIEVLNPVDFKVVSGTIPKLKAGTIASIDVGIPKHWIEGIYRINLLDRKTKAILNSSFFALKTSNAFVKHLTVRALRPQWQLQYKLTLFNPTSKPVGNFSAFVAVPITIPPQQIVTKLVVQPSELKLSSDVEGNNWLHMEVPRIRPQQSLELQYVATVQRKPLLFPSELVRVQQQAMTPYSKAFLKTYLSPEAHIESTHPAIVELAKNILSDRPLTFVKRAVQVVNQIVKYELQSEEYGAAYAVEQRKGDCTEFAALFVALCRAKGIPARVCAGFALGKSWERHATAECMINGRWIPVDVTGQKSHPIFLGSRTNAIILTRGNWMGGTLAQEVSYRYQILDPTQKLDIKVDWKVTLLKQERTKLSGEPSRKQSIRILAPQETVIKKKVKILEELSPESFLKESPKPTAKDFIKITNASKTTKGAAAVTPITITLSLPDIITNNRLKKSGIVLKNTTEVTQRGCLEIRERDCFGVLRVVAFQGVLLQPKSTKQLNLSIPIERKGLVSLEFLFMNRIGRVLGKKEKTLSIF